MKTSAFGTVIWVFALLGWLVTMIDVLIGGAPAINGVFEMSAVGVLALVGVLWCVAVRGGPAEKPKP